MSKVSSYEIKDYIMKCVMNERLSDPFIYYDGRFTPSDLEAVLMEMGYVESSWGYCSHTFYVNKLFQHKRLPEVEIILDGNNLTVTMGVVGWTYPSWKK